MKRIILLSSMLIMGLTAGYGQWSFEARAGANAATFDSGETRMALGFKAGLITDYAFSGRVSLRPGLFFSMKGASEEGSRRFEYDGDKIYRNSYLEIPVWVSVRFPVTSQLGLALNAGPYAAYRLGGTKKELTDVKDFDAGIGAGLDFLIGRHWSVGVEGQYGFTHVAKLVGKSQNNINYSLLVGYRF